MWIITKSGAAVNSEKICALEVSLYHKDNETESWAVWSDDRAMLGKFDNKDDAKDYIKELVAQFNGFDKIKIGEISE